MQWWVVLSCSVVAIIHMTSHSISSYASVANRRHVLVRQIISRRRGYSDSIHISSNKCSFNHLQRSHDVRGRRCGVYEVIASARYGTKFDDNDNDLIFSTNKDNDNVRSKQSSIIDIKRFILFNALAIILALGANFIGITSTLMSITNPEYFRSLKLDELYAINDFRRYSDADDKYEFVFPSDWVQDRTILLANIRDREIPQMMRKNKGSSTPKPDVAYGPMNTNGKENVSVIKSQVMPGFSIREVLGSPKEAAEYLLSNKIAPAASGKQYNLLDAREEIKDGRLYYIFEYTLEDDARNIHQHTVSVITNRGTELYTLTATAPIGVWDQDPSRLMQIAASFQLTGQSPLIPVGFY